MFNKQRLSLSLGLLVAGFSMACGNDNRGVEAAREPAPAAPAADRSETLSAGEMDFVRAAATSHIQEIDMATLAGQKSQNNDVKSFAKMLAEDHQGALDDLTSIMRQYGMPQPGNEAKDPAAVEAMGKLSSAQFDREFVNTMVAKHQKALDTYRAQKASVVNDDLKDHVDDFLAKIQDHLTEAEKLQQAMGGPKPAN